METYDKGVKPLPTESKNENRNNGRLWSGLIIVAVGLLFLARELDFDLPHWIFSWKMVIVGIGLYIGAKQSFKPGGWMIAVAIGTIFIADEYIDEVYLKPYIIPAAIIAVGLYVIFKPKSRDKHD